MKGIKYIYKVTQTTKNPMAFTVDGTEKIIEITSERVYIKTDLDHFEARKGDQLILFEWEMEGKLQTQVYDHEGNYLGNLLFMDTFFYDGVEPVTRICKE